MPAMLPTGKIPALVSVLTLAFASACVAPTGSEDGDQSVDALSGALIGYPGAVKVRAASSRVHGARPKTQIKRIVIHALTGFYTSQIEAWQQGGNGIGAHYIVSKQGQITQMISDLNIAYHVPDNNSDTIGIEHEDASDHARKTYENDPQWATDVEYHASAKLVAWLAQAYNVPIDRQHIKGHVEVKPDHSDPGKFFDWTKFMGYVRAEAAGSLQPTPPPSGDVPAPPGPDADPQPTPGDGLPGDASGGYYDKALLNKICSSTGGCNPYSDGTGLICVGGRCTPGCNTSGQCHGAETCQSGKCR